VTGGNPIAVLLQSISGVSAINPLVAFYDIHGGNSDIVVCIIACYVKGRGFDSRTIRKFVCMNMSVCIESQCSYVYIHTYISLTLYSRRDSRGVSEIPPRRPRFTKIT
jgi:hypothetical protein